MKHPRRLSAIGAVTGLAFAIGLVIVGLSGVAQDVPALKPIEYVMAVPPLLVPAVRRLSDIALVIVYFAWWPAVGAAIGVCLEKGRSGRIAAAVFIIVLAIGHVQALDAIHQDLEGVADIISKILTEVFDLLQK